LILVLVAVVVPVAVFLCAHYLFLRSMHLVSTNLSHTSGRVDGLALLVSVHAMVLLALALYVVAVAPLALASVPNSVSEAWPEIKGYFDREGYLVAHAVGKSFLIYGIVPLAVPLAALLPHGTGWGAFSITYVLLIIAVPLSSRAKVAATMKQLRGHLGSLIGMVRSRRESGAPQAAAPVKAGTKRTIK
jgi:hypothetical protein